jgi:hypothetical protein
MPPGGPVPTNATIRSLIVVEVDAVRSYGPDVLAGSRENGRPTYRGDRLECIKVN